MEAAADEAWYLSQRLEKNISKLAKSGDIGGSSEEVDVLRKAIKKLQRELEDADQAHLVGGIEEMAVALDSALCVLNDMATYDNSSQSPLRLQVKYINPVPVIRGAVSQCEVQVSLVLCRSSPQDISRL